MTRRSVRLLLAAAAILLSSVAPLAAAPGPGTPAPVLGAAAQQTDPPQLTFTYEVTAEGAVGTDPDAFAADVGDILGDARGWTMAGSIAFAPVSSGGDLTVVLASPGVVEAAAPVCSRHYSCRVGDRVYINDDNWRNATSAWNRTGAPRWLYRQYLINHEVGHWLGEGHRDCPGSGEPAPVMQQQSIALGGCEPNGWPLEGEREQVADRYGVPVHDWIFPDVLASYVHRDAIHALVGGGIVVGFEDGSFRPNDDVTRAQVASYLARALDLEAEGPPPFDDVGTSGAHVDAIAAAAGAGVVRGYEDGTYRPSEATTRAHMASVIARAYGLDAEGDPAFADVPAHHPHAEGIAAVAEAGVAEGHDDGTFRPDEPVTRGQMAAFIARAEGEV